MTPLKIFIIIALVPLLVWAVRRWIKMVREWEREDREDLFREYRIPTEEQAKAAAVYGPHATQALTECRESHLPGDCPLCGAE